MYEHRMLAGGSDRRTIRRDTDIFLLGHVYRQMAQNWLHLKSVLVAVVAQNLAMPFGHRLVRGHQTPLRAHPSTRCHATGLERESGFMHLVQDIVHRVMDGAGDGAVDGRCGGLVFKRAGIRRDAARRNGAMTQGPEKRFIPLFAKVFRLDIGKRARNALIGIVHRFVDGRSILGSKTVLLIPDVERRFLEGNTVDVFGLYFDHRIHGYEDLPSNYRAYESRRRSRLDLKRPIG